MKKLWKIVQNKVQYLAEYRITVCAVAALLVCLAGCMFLRNKIELFTETGAISESIQKNTVNEENGGDTENSGNVENSENVENGGESENNTSDTQSGSEEKKEYIKWVEFHVTKEALQLTYEYDVQTHETEHPVHWVELLAYFGAKYGGDFSRFEPADMNAVVEKLSAGETTMEQLTKGMEYYAYYQEAYDAILGGMVGEYQIPESDSAAENGEVAGNDSAVENGKVSGSNSSAETSWKTQYGLKAFHPIAKGFPYSDYDDFGVSRSYGYKREHLGHDMMGQVGTPVIAVESGYIAELGWNEYGGWRVGINSFDGRRYYYYAHLRQNVPFAAGLEKGSVVQAGDVIGYIGRTGYSKTENVNNIDEYHLHFGLQLIFDESQREGNNQIWIDVYPLVRFLYQNQSETVRDDVTKEWSRVVPMADPAAQEYKDTHGME